jgi:integrase/recombinase XerC/integrase/recombinase XerD
MRINKYSYKEGRKMNELTEAPKGAPLAAGKADRIVDQLVDLYIGSLDVRPASKETYRKGVRRFSEWLSVRGIASPCRSDVLDYKADMLKTCKACTVSSYISAVKSFYAYLESERIAPNIAAGIKGAKRQKGFRKDSLTAGQANEVIAGIDASTLEGKRNRALVNLLVRTGLRTVEAARANIEDIRSEAGEALLYIQGKGRDSKDDFVILTEGALKPIRQYLKARGRTPDDAPLFASHSDRNSGERLTTRSMSRIAKEALIAAGYDDSRLTAHSMRHTAVTLSLLGGASIQEAQALARHQNINTTLIYAHNISRMASAPERKIDALLAI